MTISPNQKSLVYALLCLVVIALQYQLYVRHPIKNELKDYSVYVEAGERFSENRELYKDPYLRAPYLGTGPKFEMYYFYPPYFAAVHSILNRSGAASAKLSWALINFMALLGGAIALWALLRSRFSEVNPNLLMLYVLLSILCFQPVFAGALEGQVNPTIFFALSYFLLLIKRDKEKPAGIVLGLAAALKISPLVVLGGVPFAKGRKVLVSLIFTILLVLLISFVLGVSQAHYLSFLDAVFFVGRQKAHPMSVFNFSAPVLLAKQAAVFGVLTYLVLILVAIWRSRGNSSKLSVYAIWICVMFCVSPLVWYHHLLWLLPPLAVFLCFTPEGENSTPHLVKGAAVYFVLNGSYVFHLQAARSGFPVLEVVTGLVPFLAALSLIYLLKPEVER